METPQFCGVSPKERIMTTTRKTRLVRLGDAKRLTKGQGTLGVEINLQPLKK